MVFFNSPPILLGLSMCLTCFTFLRICCISWLSIFRILLMMYKKNKGLQLWLEAVRQDTGGHYSLFMNHLKSHPDKDYTIYRVKHYTLTFIGTAYYFGTIRTGGWGYIISHTHIENSIKRFFYTHSLPLKVIEKKYSVFRVI